MVGRGPPPLSAQRGFSLLELLAAVAILAVLSAVAAPSFTGLIASQRIKGISTDLFTALTRARSEAVKRNIDITLTPTRGGQWQYGWSIPNPADSGHVLDDHAAIPSAVITGPASVVYQPNGRIRASAAPAFDIAIGDLPHRCVQVDLSGRPYQKSAGC